QTFLHFQTTQIEEAVLQTHVFTHSGVTVEREGNGFGFVKDFKRSAINFDFTGSHVRVNGCSSAGAHSTGNLQHILAAHFVGQSKIFFGIGIKHYLHNTVAVAQVDKDNATMIATTVNPTTKGYFLINKSGIQSAT